MIEKRLTIPLHPDYAAALGTAIYCFADLEWKAVWCCDLIEPGSIESLEERTAGRVADTLLHLVKRLQGLDGQAELGSAAADFRFLVGTRNNLVHAKPGIDQNGAQGLVRNGDYWTVDELKGVADAFVACSRRLDKALSVLSLLRTPMARNF